MASANWKSLATQLKQSAPKKTFKRKLPVGSEGKPASSGPKEPPNKKRKSGDSEAQKEPVVDLKDVWFDDVKEEDIRAAYGLSGSVGKGGKAGEKTRDGIVSEASANKWVVGTLPPY